MRFVYWWWKEQVPLLNVYTAGFAFLLLITGDYL